MPMRCSMSAPARSTTSGQPLPIGEGHALVDEIIRPRALHLVTVEFASEGEAGAFRPPNGSGLR